jgi:hypothetical protein
MKNKSKSKSNNKDKESKTITKKIDKAPVQTGKQISSRPLKSPNMGFHGSDDERSLNAEE